MKKESCPFLRSRRDGRNLRLASRPVASTWRTPAAGRREGGFVYADALCTDAQARDPHCGWAVLFTRTRTAFMSRNPSRFRRYRSLRSRCRMERAPGRIPLYLSVRPSVQPPLGMGLRRTIVTKHRWPRIQGSSFAFSIRRETHERRYSIVHLIIQFIHTSGSVHMYLAIAAITISSGREEKQKNSI